MGSNAPRERAEREVPSPAPAPVGLEDQEKKLSDESLIIPDQEYGVLSPGGGVAQPGSLEGMTSVGASHIRVAIFESRGQIRLRIRVTAITVKQSFHFSAKIYPR